MHRQSQVLPAHFEAGVMPACKATWGAKVCQIQQGPLSPGSMLIRSFPMHFNELRGHIPQLKRDFLKAHKQNAFKDKKLRNQ